METTLNKIAGEELGRSTYTATMEKCEGRKLTVIDGRDGDSQSAIAFE